MRLGRSWITLALAALPWVAPPATDAQPGGPPRRIGVLENTDAASNAPNLSAFRERLAELGYVEGRDFALEYRSSEGRAERLADLAAELVRLRVDVMVTRGTPAALAAKHATSTIPVVMASSGEPAMEGVVASLARPGGNVTGFHTMVSPEEGSRRLRLLKEATPRASRIGVLWNSIGVYSPLILRETENVARAAAVSLKSLDVQRPEALEPAFEAALMDRVDGLIVMEDYLTVADLARIVDFAARSRLPAIYPLREFVDSGGLMSYGVDRRDLFRRAAGYVDRILKGARPGDLPIEPPTRLELAINLRAARSLGLTIPASLLQRADYVIP